MEKNKFNFLKLFGFFAPLFITASMLLSVPLSAQDCQALIERGDNYYEQFDNKNALQEYKKAHENCPDSYDALAKLARTYNDYAEDLKEKDEAGAEKNFKKAIEYAEKLRESFPNKAETYYLLAATHGNLSKFKGGKERVELAKDVEKNAKKAIEIDPNYAPAYLALGIYYREVASLSPILKELARTFYGELPDGTFEASTDALRNAVRLRPKVVYTNFELAKTYDKMNMKKSALKYYSRAAELPITDHGDKEKKEEAKRNVEELNGKK